MTQVGQTVFGLRHESGTRRCDMYRQEEIPMVPLTAAPRSATFTIGWIALLLISAFAALNHLLLEAVRDSRSTR
jgi:hypothetical protein